MQPARLLVTIQFYSVFNRSRAGWRSCSYKPFILDAVFWSKVLPDVKLSVVEYLENDPEDVAGEDDSKEVQFNFLVVQRFCVARDTNAKQDSIFNEKD